MTADATWTWRYDTADGTAVTPPIAPDGGFDSQVEAEAWIGENFENLRAEHGVDNVTLLHQSAVVYGPMSLHPEA